MTWNYILLWFAGSSCVVNLINASRASPPLRGWVGVSAFILAIAAFLYYLHPDIAGLTAGSLWMALVLAPALLQRRIARLTVAQQYATGWRLASVVRWLHPFDGVWQQARLLRALDVAESGSLDEAAAMLEQVASDAPPRVARAATGHRFRLLGEWPQLIAFVERSASARSLQRDPQLLSAYLRALGETGQINEMLATIERYRDALDSPAFTNVRHMCRLQAFVFAGEPDHVQHILTGPLRVLPPVAQQYWIGTAELAAGQIEAGTGRLLTIEESATPGARRAIARRLAQPPAIARPILLPQAIDVLRRLDRERDQEERFATIRTAGRRPWVTYGIILANAAMFVAEWYFGGTTSEAAHTRLGAFHPDEMREGQYWRLLTANFLHFGIAHILLNMLALFVLGPFVEFAIGGALYLLIYLASGVLAIGTVWVFQLLGWMQPDWLVGASGAIMGLIGATAAIQLRGWWRERARVAWRRLRLLGLILVMQAIFDAMTPEVSGTAHLAGAAWGFVLCSIVPHRTTSRRRQDSA
ncbi:MAG TPA: rhomboid family intramembrane serine protease [Tepidisphaeraceae bacterium]|nr:rhomboid family intramembrane serine protease [Tepidisphaeraceae bacterium]